MTLSVLQNIPENDPLVIPAQKAVIDQIIIANKSVPGATMVILNELQSRIVKVPYGAVHGVVSFYSFFTTQPRGRHTLKFCMGTACYVGGMPQLIEKAKQQLGIEMGQTTKDGAITLEVCRCVGACSQAPVIVADDEAVGRVKPNKLPQLIRKCEAQ